MNKFLKRCRDEDKSDEPQGTIQTLTNIASSIKNKPSTSMSDDVASKRQKKERQWKEEYVEYGFHIESARKDMKIYVKDPSKPLLTISTRIAYLLASKRF